MISWVAHLLEHDALFHLTDEFLLDDAHQVCECMVYGVGVELIVLSHALGEEVFPALTGEDGHSVGWDRVDIVCKAELRFNICLVHLAKAYALFEEIGVFGVEEEREAGYLLLLGAVSTGDHLELAFGLVVADNADWAPGVLLVDVHRREGVGLVRPFGAILKPLLNIAVLFPGIVAGKDLGTGHSRVTEDFILLLKDGNGFFGGAVFLAQLGFFVVFGEERRLFNDVLMLLNEISVSCRETLQLQK